MHLFRVHLLRRRKSQFAFSYRRIILLKSSRCAHTPAGDASHAAERRVQHIDGVLRVRTFLGRLRFAGEHLSPEYWGYAHGAWQSAECVVADVLGTPKAPECTPVVDDDDDDDDEEDDDDGRRRVRNRGSGAAAGLGGQILSRSSNLGRGAARDTRQHLESPIRVVFVFLLAAAALFLHAKK